MAEGSTRKPNRRGVAAREQLLSTALRLLGEGRPESVSINLVAKEAGLSWGSVQNLYGDSDGFWSAVIDQIVDGSGDLWAEPVSDDIAGRVAEVAGLYRNLLSSPYSIAIETIRNALPRPRATLAQTHPKSAESLTRVEQAWEDAFLGFFAGIDDFDTERARDVAAVLHSALRGLHLDHMLGTDTDFERAHATLVAAMTSYLENPPGN